MNTPPATPSHTPADTSRLRLDWPTAARLTEFARACKAATRAVSLYPPAHPAVGASLDRLVAVAARTLAQGSFAISVLPDVLLIDGAAPERPDAAVGELAALLHDHLIGEIEIVSAADAAAWRSLLGLLGQAPADLLAQGGIARLWAGSGGDHVRIREVDYAEVLRERGGGAAVAWTTIVQHCLENDGETLDEASIRALLDAAERADGLTELVEHLGKEAAEGGPRVQVEALARLLQRIAETTRRRHPDRVEHVLGNMARVAGRLSPEMILGLLARRAQSADDAAEVVGQVMARMSDDTIGGFVAQSFVERRGATERLAEAFQALVPDEARRAAVLGLAQPRVAESPLGQEEEFPKLWQQATEMLLSYRDEPFVSETYAQQLSTARANATDVERIADDPPEQIAAWLATISDANVRTLDLQLLLDLLRIEEDAGQWDVVASFVTTHLDDLFLLGDFEAAEPLVAALARESEVSGRSTHRASAISALERTLRGQLMTQLVGHLRTIDDAGFDHVRRLCLTLGTAVIRPLAEALAVEERGRAFRRLTDLLTAFGSSGREAVEQLKSSTNPAVRRTAIYLLREFGGDEALPELESLLDDADANIQREAVRAIALIGSKEAYGVLYRALASGSQGQREAIVNAIGSMRDERAVPLFCHMVRSAEYRRTMHRAYATALEGLGWVGGSDAVAALGEALHQGDWYAPFRTAAQRRAAAAALRRIGTQEALGALRAAVEQGSRRVRAIAREQLAQVRPRQAPDGGRA